jgi:hypothetical protein
MNRMSLILFDMDNRIFGSYLAAISRIHISAMTVTERKRAWRHPDIGVGYMDAIHPGSVLRRLPCASLVCEVCALQGK